MTNRRDFLFTAAAAAPMGVAIAADDALSRGSPLALFAVEFHTGSAWMAERPGSEQAYFQEHLASLNRLRSDGRLVAGVRYADKALMILAGTELAQIRDEIDRDPAVSARVFRYEIYPLRVHYGGCLSSPQA